MEKVKGLWEQHRGLVWKMIGFWPFSVIQIDRPALEALHWTTKTEMCYDPETPPAALNILRVDEDATVRQGVACRPGVLRGDLMNPFEQAKTKKEYDLIRERDLKQTTQATS